MIKEFELPKSIESPFTGIVLKLIEPDAEGFCPSVKFYVQLIEI